MPNTLTLEDLNRALTTYAVPEWVTEIRNASEVAVRPSRYLPAGDSYVVVEPDLRAIALGEPESPDARRMVVCHPDDEGRIRNIVREIRAPESEEERDDG